ncbi:MAG: hypothetical protein V3T00_09600 [bacterium]
MKTMTRTFLHLPAWMVPVVLAASLSIARPAQAIWNYFTPAEVLEVAFPNGESIQEISWKLMDRAKKKEIELALGRTLAFRRMKCFQGSSGGAVVGYACIDNVIGRSRPITYMIKIGHPGGAIVHYEIMIYREAIGKETGFGSFRDQFRGKKGGDPFEYGVDLRNLAGATMSAVGLRDGFVKIMAVYEHFFKDLPVLFGQSG